MKRDENRNQYKESREVCETIGKKILADKIKVESAKESKIKEASDG